MPFPLAPRSLGRYLTILLLLGGFGSLLFSKPLSRRVRRERAPETDLHAEFEFPLEATNDSPRFCALPEPPSSSKLDPWDTSHVVVGPPTKNFRDNLLKDKKYITTWSNAGFTNQFMGYVNMIYLGMISDRIPIISPFAPDHHIARDAGILTFGEVFNLTHLRSALGNPVLEWADVKDVAPSSIKDPYSNQNVEPLGCWSTRALDNAEPIRAENIVHHLGLDVSYTRVPLFTRLNPPNTYDAHTSFDKLSALIYPNNPIAPLDSYPHMSVSPLGSHAPPEEQLSCFDVLYYLSSGVDVYEWRFPWSPAWRFVGRHVVFNEPLVNLGKEYLRLAIHDGEDTGDEEEIPPFIAVHVRRGDFGRDCPDRPEDCLVPLDRFVEAVQDVQRELHEKHGVHVPLVYATSDETDPEFWAQVSGLGWRYVNHTAAQTVARLGEWHAPLVDIVAQSLAMGFVGTLDSTFSLVSAKRVVEWNDGVSRMV